MDKTQTTKGWRPIKTFAGQYGHIDVWAKKWDATTDTFSEKRFVSVSPNGHGQLLGPHNYGDGWFATHWMPEPRGPNER